MDVRWQVKVLLVGLSARDPRHFFVDVDIDMITFGMARKDSDWLHSSTRIRSL